MTSWRVPHEQMADQLFRDLSWLPRAPEDFKARCRNLSEKTADMGRHIRDLSAFALDENQLHRLARIITSARESRVDLSPLIPFKLGLLSNSTVDFMIPVLVATAARHGIALECISGSYDQVIQDALSADSAVNRAKPDAVLIAVDYRAFHIQATPSNPDESQNAVRRALAFLENVRNGIRSNCNALCIVQTIAGPPERIFGSLDRVIPGTLRSNIDRINSELSRSIIGTLDVLMDVAGLAETVGLDHWHSPTQWNLAKLPFSSDYLPLYADHVGRLLAALRGRNRRVLVLDLDNTVWGGEIGEAGLEGILCAQGNPTGEAYLSVQKLALELRERGIVLAASSKNNDETARSPFRNHPDMLLKEEHFAVFQANWSDKATNIQAIARELSLGTDSMVFLDDSPVERNLVRRILPEVAVPELPSDPALYARTLSAAGYFEAVTLSDEDLKRADHYQGNARRVELRAQAGDVEVYLQSLRMQIEFQPFDESGRGRIAQLINKSNQFNLTAKRYTEADVAAVETDQTCFTLQVRLTDVFGDNGMICVVICRREPEAAWEIDTWLMSCRVLGRRVENMVLKQIVGHASSLGVRKLRGVYRPTGRNGLVENHYARLGFVLVRGDQDGSTVWDFNTDRAIVDDAPMTVIGRGFD